MSRKRAEQVPDFVVDDDNGSLMNTNLGGLEGYRAQREAIRRAKNDHERIATLEKSMDRIETLLIRILNK